MKTIEKENSDFLIDTNIDDTNCGKESEAIAILNEDKLHPNLDAGNIAIFSSIINDTLIAVEGSNPDAMLDATTPQIGIKTVTSEPEIGNADHSFSTNASADGYLIGKEITGEIGFLATNDNAIVHDNLGLFPGIENASCSISVCGDLLIDEQNVDLLSLDSQGVAINKAIYEIGSLASCDMGILMDTSLGNIDGGNEFLVADSSLGDMFYGAKLTEESSFIGTPGDTFLDVGIDSNYELGAVSHVGVSNIQAVNKLIDADLESGFNAYKPSEILSDGIARTANDFETAGISILGTLDESNVFSTNGLANSGKLNYSIENQWDGSAGIEKVNLADSFDGNNWSLENISSGRALNSEISFLGNSEDSFFDVGTDFNQDFEVFSSEDVLVEQVVNEALEEFGKSFKIKDSEISIKSFTKTFQVNSSYSSSNIINMVVVNYINIEGDAKHNTIYLTENNDGQ